MKKEASKTKKRCSLRDVAKAADLSVTTVHRILTGQDSRFISESTVEKVKQLAEELGWRQNVGYKMMHGDTIHCVGVVVSSPQLRQREPFNELLIEVVDTLNRKGFSTNIMILGYEEEENLKRIREQLSHGAESFIMIGDPVGYIKIEQEIKKAGCPFIGMGYLFSRRVVNCPGEARLELIRQFVKSGFRKLKYVMYSGNSEPERMEAELIRKIYPPEEAEEILRNIFYLCDTPPSTDTDIQATDHRSGKAIAAKMLTLYPDLQAVIFPSDAAALGAAAAFIAHGKKIGVDLVIGGFFNSSASRLSPIPISSVGFDVPVICSHLIERAFDNEPCCIEVPGISYCRLDKNTQKQQ